MPIERLYVRKKNLNAHLQEERNKNLIYEPSKLFLSPTKVQYWTAFRIYDYWLKVCSDKGLEFMAKMVRRWLSHIGVQTLYIGPGSPWENDYIESFNGKFRDELLNREIFYTLKEAKTLIEKWRMEYNTFRPHSSLNYRPPVPEAHLN